MAGTDMPPQSPPARYSSRSRRFQREIVVSAVIARTFSIWIGTLPQLLVAAAIVEAPFEVLKWLLRGRGEAMTQTLFYIDLFAASPLVEAFVVQLVFQRLRREPVELARSIVTGGRRIATVLGIAAILNVPTLTATLLHSTELPLGFLLSALLGVANLMMLLIFCVPAPVAVVERRGILDSLRRSRHLTHGSRGTIFGIFVVLGLLAIAISLVFMLIPTPKSEALDFLLEAVGNVVSASISSVIPIVLYHELREKKEGIGLDEIAAIFE